jgi:hypothetical protein
MIRGIANLFACALAAAGKASTGNAAAVPIVNVEIGQSRCPLGLNGVGGRIRNDATQHYIGGKAHSGAPALAPVSRSPGRGGNPRSGRIK